MGNPDITPMNIECYGCIGCAACVLCTATAALISLASSLSVASGGNIQCSTQNRPNLICHQLAALLLFKNSVLERG